MKVSGFIDPQNANDPRRGAELGAAHRFGARPRGPQCVPAIRGRPSGCVPDAARRTRRICRLQARCLAALSEHHLPCQRGFNRRHEFERRQGESAQRSEGREVDGEEARERIG